MKEVFQKICLALFGLVITLLLFEGFAWVAPRSWLPARLSELGDAMERNRRSDSFFIPDSELLFKMPPNTNFVVRHPDYTIRIKTNLNLSDIGFRGGTLGGPAWGVAVGDSFTFGMGVEQEETWVGRLAKSLGHEVINFGIPAQGPAQYTRVLKRYALPMRPRVVFYGFYFNDLDSATRFRRMKRQLIPVGRYVRHYSYAFNLVRESKASPQVQPALAKADNVEMSLDPEGLRRTLERQNRSFDERWELTVREVDDAIKASKDAGVIFVLLYLPSRWEIYWDSLKKQSNLPDSLDIDRLRRTVVSYCGKQKVVCLDLTRALKREAVGGKRLYFPIDGHWNREGNRVVAEAVREFILAKGIVE
jgi:hypothetical protein